MQRFFLPNFTPLQSIELDDADIVHQIGHVLRSSPGTIISLFNGDSHDYIYSIVSISKKTIQCNLVSEEINTATPKRQIRLYQALPNKYEKIEYILQKGVEVGIDEFVFFRSERSQKLVINERKIERFTDIAREALEQSWGNRFPKISFCDSVGPRPDSGFSLVFHTKSELSIGIKDIVDSENILNLYVGPEGGWSEAEMIHFKKEKVQIVHLGERILRTETTGIVSAFFLIQK